MQMKKRWNTAMLTYKTVWSVDRFYFLYTIVYNLLKQFFNVFYSVYFLRTLLAYIENGQSVLRIVALLRRLPGLPVASVLHWALCLCIL